MTQMVYLCMGKCKAFYFVILLAVGVVACKKDDIHSPAGIAYAQGPVKTAIGEVFTIRDTSEYNASRYYVHLGGMDIIAENMSKYVDLDGNGVYDLRFTNVTTFDTAVGTHYTQTTCYNLQPDSVLLFSKVGNATEFKFQPYNVGYTVGNNIFWAQPDSVVMFSLEFNNLLNYHQVYYWNAGAGKDYILFKMKVNGTYKYGWLLVNYNATSVGASVIER